MGLREECFDDVQSTDIGPFYDRILPSGRSDPFQAKPDSAFFLPESMKKYAHFLTQFDISEGLVKITSQTSA